MMDEDERDAFIVDLFRPRDAFDEDVDPESMRGKALTYMDLLAGVDAMIARHITSLPWYRRWPTRLVVVGVRLRLRLAAAIRRA
jgi:hypothetical protein